MKCSISKKNNINLLLKKLTFMLALFAVLLSFKDVKAANSVYNFSYTGNYQTFTAPYDGTYKIQLWGAQGGTARENNSLVTVGGYGAYTAGMIELKKGQVLYIYVGGNGGNGVKSGYGTAGWNGGGRGEYDHSDDEAAGGGGGATDVRLVSGSWNDFASLKSRIMVAAGGGGSAPRWGSGPIAFGGTLESPATNTSSGATQTSGYAFGVGQSPTFAHSNSDISGAGGGYYGGLAKSTATSQDATGSGGSSFISGYNGCNAIAETSTSTNIIHTGQSIHYSGLSFDHAIMIRGNGYTQKSTTALDTMTQMPNPTGGYYAASTGRSGAGYATITYYESLKSSDYPNYSIKEGKEYKYAYTGNYQTFTAPANGTYKFEAWGARGGSGSQNRTAIRGGYGGYAAGNIHLKKGDTFYIYVGQVGYNYAANCSYCGGYGGYNGGGNGGNDSNRDSSPDEGGGGGGATDFRTVSGTWNTFDSLKSRILIAGGGGGGNFSGIGGSGGGVNGVMGYGTKALATQTSGYSFGTGMAGGTCTDGAGGGGGGYYGGRTGTTCGYGGGGGSAFVSGHPSCNAISSTSTTSNIIHTGQSSHYSGYVFSSPTIVDGSNSMPNTAGTGTMTGNNGNGYAKVTILELDAGHPNLATMTIDGATIQPDFDPETYDYDVYVDSENYEITIDGTVLHEDDMVFRGLDTIELKSGANKHLIGLINDLGNVTLYNLKINRPASSYQYLDGIKIDGEPISGFSPEVTEYTINIPDTTEEVNIEALLGRPSQTVTGAGKIEVGFGTTTQEINVLSEDGNVLTTYTITFQKSNSSKLKSLKIEDYALNPEFDPETLEYTIEIATGSLYVDVDAIAYDKTATVKIEGNGYLPVNKKNQIVITVDQENVDSTTYIVNVEREGSVENEEYVYNCTSKYQTFEAPATTYYKIQAWGARGGYGRTHWALKYRGGFGAYTEGEIHLKKGEKLYLYVGCAGANSAAAGKCVGGAGGWNGGAAGGNDSNCDSASEPGGGGGGSSDIRLVPTGTNTSWNEFESLKSRIMIAAGAGGGNFSGVGGAGGNINGTTGYGKKSIATQTSGYAFGYGMAGGSCTDGAGGAGGGYFGGYSGTGCGYGGGGGSSFVSGCTNCVGITETSLLTNIVSNEKNTHYSGYTFENITMLTGDESMPSPNGGYMTGNNDNGHIIITGGRDRSSDNFLRNITVDKGTLSPTFDLQTLEYNVEVGAEDDTIKIGAKLSDDTATVTGTGTFDVPAGETSFPLTVTAENGEIRIYTVNVTRPQSNNSKPIDIVISGLVPSLCALNEEYCKVSPSFNPNTNSYDITVPARIKQVEFTVIKGHKYQKVSGDGVVSLQGGMNLITIEVMSEDGNSTSHYTYNINRDMTGNTTIEDLKVLRPNININFDPDLTDYYFSVPNDTSDLDLEVTLEDLEASYEIIDNENFEVGLNVVTIRVTAKNGETKDYILNVYQEKNGNIFLNDLKVINGDEEYSLNPVFNKIVTTYVVNVPNEVDKADIVATAEHPLTVITGDGEKELSTGTNNFNVTTTADNGDTEIYKISIIREKNSDATLKSLDIAETTLDPSFDSLINTYYLDVAPGITTLNINAIPNRDTSKVQITGNSGFKVGNNIAKITVTAEDGTKNVYTLNVNRVASDNNYLSALNTDRYDMSGLFDKDIQEYDIELENDITTITVTAEKEDRLSKISGTGKYNLKTGDNEINIQVTSETGDTRIYTLHVFRKLNSNANLFSITSNEDIVFNPVFEKDTVDYRVEVENAVTNISLIAIPEVKTSTVEGNGTYNLSVGENLITFKVTAEDGSTKDYRVVINRNKSSNANLESLFAQESVLDPVFNKTTTTYSLRVLEDVTSLTLKYAPENDAAEVEVIGNEDFGLGYNVVIVRVTAEDGETVKEYTLNVLRQAEGEASSKLLNLNMLEKAFHPDFASTTLYYEVEVPYSISTATLEGELEDKNATVVGLGQHSLIVGENNLAVQVTSTEGVVRTYQVVVTRLENDEARLSNLMVSGSSLSPIFNKDTYEYSISTQDAVLDITATTLDQNATYEIIGNSDLQLGENDVIIKVTAKDGHTEKEYTLHVNKLPSNNNNLAWLQVDGVTISPEFSKTTTVYYATVSRDTNNIQIDGAPDDPNATVEGIGDTSLEVGVNYKEIEVTSQSGLKKIYTLIITRTPNDNNYLESLTIDQGTLTPIFDKNINSYSVTVPYEVDKISLEGFAEDETATVTGLDIHSLKVGQNDINVVVESEAGNKRTYTLTVVREDVVSSLLQSLSIKNYLPTPIFSSEIFDYNITVDNEVTNLDLTYVTMDKKATVTVRGNSGFNIGLNTVEIEVVDSKNLTTSTYTINVNRQAYSNTYLSYIAVSRGELVPDFEKSTLTYDVEVSNETTSITIDAEAEVESNTLTGTGTFDLEPGKNVFPLKVTSKNGIVRTYYVNVFRALKDDNFLETLQAKVNNNLLSLNPSFEKEHLTYTLNVPTGTTEIVFSGSFSEGATVTGLGSQKVKLGENTYEIAVTSEAGNVRIYTVVVNRPASDDNYLTSLIPSVGTLSPAFSYFGTEYSLKLDSAASLLSFDVNTSDQFATVTGIDREIVPDGASVRKITVTAEDGTKRIYTININKDRTDEARLQSLSVAGYTFTENFDSDKFTYTINVPNSKRTLLASEVTAVPIDANATVNKTSSITLGASAANLYTIVVTAKDGFTKQTYYIAVNRAKGSEAKLASLKFSTGQLEPTFNSDLMEYKLYLPNSVDEMIANNVTAVATADDAIITKMERLVIEGDRDDPTKDIYEVKVTSGDGSTTNVYKIKMIYLQSSDATLKELSVSEGTFGSKFDRNTFTYTVNVTDATDFIVIDGLTNHEKATIISGLGEHNLPDMKNKVEITVQAEDGTIKVYTLNIVKSITLQTQLDDLYLTGDCDKETCSLVPNFDSDILDYKTTVENDIENIGIEYTKRHENQQVIIFDSLDNELDKNNITLRVGDNKLKVQVLSSIGDETIYNLTINRKKSDNNYLSELSITNPSSEDTKFNFDKETLEYYVTIPIDIDDVTINAVKEHSKAVVRISGSKGLEVGNNDIIISVQAENGDIREYIIHALKESDSNNYLESITVSSGTIYKLSPKFNKGIYDYVVSVPSNISKVNLDAVPELETTVVTGTGEKNLKTGVNSYDITSTSKEGTVSTYHVIVNKAKADKLYLKSLSVDEASLDPDFDKETLKYDLSISSSVDNLTINAIPEEDDVDVKIVGNKNLVSGTNNVYIVLSNKDKTITTTYVLNVNKDVDDNNYLKSIKVDNNELMSSNKREDIEFEIEVDSDTKQINLTGVAESSLTKVTGEGVYSLDYGDNEIKLNATSEAGNTRVYTITVKRKYNNDLFMISTDKGELTPTFDKDVLDYYLDVTRDVSEINILAVAVSDNATILGNGYHGLEVGENVIEIVVKSDDESSKTYKLHITRNESNDATLTNLYVREGVIDPVFDPDTNSYTVEVPYDTSEITIDYTTSDNNATVEIVGNEDLKLGENTVKVKVTAEDGSKNTYTIKVIVQDEAEYSNKLKSLTVDKGVLSPDFDPDTSSYTVTVDNDVNAITLTGVLESVNARATGLGKHSLELGRNEFPIVVTSKDGKTRTYSVIVYRIKSSDARLKNVTFAEGVISPLFDKDTHTYTMNVDSSVQNLTESVEVLVSGTTYKIEGNHNLSLGENTITITSTAADLESTETYIFKVTKEKSTDNFLESLESNIGTLNPNFSKDNTGPYVINVDDTVNSIILSGKAVSSTSTITGLGVHQINRGSNTIPVVVTSEVGTTRTYTVIVNKSLSDDNSLYLLKTSDGDLDPEFNKDTLEYTVKVDSEVSELTVLGLATSSYAKVNGNGKYTLGDGTTVISLEVVAENGDKRVYKLNVEKEKEASSKILDLKVHEGILSPTFDKNTLEYSITVPNEVTSLTMDIELEDSESSYVVEGNENFKVGSNQVLVKVTNKNNITTTYILNVIRQTASNNYLKSLTTSYDMTPVFNRTTQYYEIEVDCDTSEIEISGEAEDSRSTVTGFGTHGLSKGDNYIHITVTSSSGVDRIYTVKVIRKLSNNNRLSNLSVNIGDLDPLFDPDTYQYEINVPGGIDKINISAVADDENATVSGDGDVSVTDGENLYEVLVTAEDGTTSIYKIKANKTSSNNTNIENIIPSSGVLSPNYTNSIDEYEVEVDDDVSLISFDVILEDSNATVSGNENIPLDYGDNDIKIKVTAEDSTEKIVNITVKRSKDITEINVDDENILMAVDDTYELHPTVLPGDATNKEIVYSSSDEDIVTVDQDGNITSHKIGEAEVTISSKKNADIKKVVNVTVLNLRLESDVYDVRHAEESSGINIVIGAEEKTTLADIQSNMKNNDSLLKFYDIEANEITDLENTYVATGQIITLQFAGKKYDQAWIVLRGDNTQDSAIDVADYNELRKQVLGKNNFEGYLFKSVDVVEDDEADVADYNMLKQYLLGKIRSLNNIDE